MPFDVSGAGDQAAHADTFPDIESDSPVRDGLRVLSMPPRPIQPPPLPNPRTSFVGREREVADIVFMLAHQRLPLVTLTGPGGVGKTRLAIEVARNVAALSEIPVAFLPLSTLRAPSRLLATVVAGSGMPDVPPDPAVEEFAQAIGARPLLLLLDNLEQLVDATPVLSQLLSACPGLQILAASRRRLRLSGEQVVLVEGLPLPDAQTTNAEALRAIPSVQLFIERASAAWPSAVWTSEQLAASAEICRLVDGEPLAIELAASRVALLPPTALLSRMDPLLPTLGTGPSDADPRLQTMRHAIQWSYDLLTPHAQRVLRQLSVFVGGCTLHEAEIVLPAGEHDLLNTLEQLADLSLVRAVTDARGELRFVIPPPVWEFANQLLMASDEPDEVCSAHADYYAAWAASEDLYWNTGNLARVTDPNSSNWPDVRAAFEWLITSNQGDKALALAWGVVDLAWFRLFGAEICDWMERAYAITADEPPSEVRVRIISWIGLMASVQADDDKAWQFANIAIEQAALVGGADLESFVYRHAGQVARNAGKLDDAIDWHRKSLEFAYLGNERALPTAHYEYGASLITAGHLEEAREAIAASFEMAEERGTAFVVALCDLAFTRLALLEGRVDDARGHLDHLLDGILDQEDLSVVAETLLRVAATAIALGDLRTAALLLGAGEALLALTIRRRFRAQPLAVEVARTLAETMESAELAQARSAGARMTREEMLAEATHLIRGTSGFNAPESGEDPLAVLSRREREVLVLLTDGKTDREIAEALFISRSTASRHVEAILRKLQVPTRTAAAVVATRTATGQVDL